jgi:hypothetical protein
MWEAGVRSSHQALAVLPSQTTTDPSAAAVARMCATCEFHATEVISAVCRLAVCRVGGVADSVLVGESVGREKVKACPDDVPRATFAGASGLHARATIAPGLAVAVVVVVNV